MSFRPPLPFRFSFALTAAILTAGCASAPVSAPVPAAGATSTLYMPRGVQTAFRKGTHLPDGRPGPNYWENHGRYSIAITALPPDRTVRGTETIVYMNNSPDTLRALQIKLLLNIHKPGAPRGGGASPDYLTSGVHIDSVSANQQPVAWRGDNAFTSVGMPLPAPLLPHDSVRLAFKWHYDVSRESGREGMLDSTSYFLAYFYPRVAVYDDYNGWDRIPFTDVQEFYSDFNDYDVSITVPANYVVWGTGTLLNPAEVVQPAALDRYNRSFTSDETMNVATRADMAAKRVTTQHPTNTWRFRANDIPDMTFALSDHYVWDAASAVVDTLSHRRASAQAAYNDTAADYHHMVQYSRHALNWLSTNWPGVPYPYEKTTVVEGLAGMEYPMMVNDESYTDTVFSRFVVEHETAHTYFPFYMGINESRYAMMDEGWATTFEYLIGIADLGQERATQFYRQFRVTGWARNPSPLEDLPIITPADALSPAAYGDNAYGKASLGYLALKDMLGDPVFRTGLHTFMDRWHGKHPIPWDFFNTFNDVTGRNLNWFWNDWYFANGYIDLGVRSVTKSGDGYTVVLDNVGGMPAPVDVLLKFADGTTAVTHETSAIWEPNLRTATVTIPATKVVQSVQLLDGIWMDANPANSVWTQH
ncbi:MAG: M1 family metallopeptidase [Gemmatimonadaceae bacterium]